MEGRRSVLVIEDEDGLQKLLRRRVEREGWIMLEARTAADGLRLAIEATPDVVVVDQHLPDANGLEVIAKLRRGAATKAIPVVAWSGDDAERSGPAVLRAGAVAYFEKTALKELVAWLVRENR
jgi:two-component system cell cycle response regulator DivK